MSKEQAALTAGKAPKTPKQEKEAARKKKMKTKKKTGTPKIAPFTTRIRAIMKVHKIEIVDEMAAFEGVQYVDEVWNIAPEKLSRMSVAYDSALARFENMNQAIIEWQPIEGNVVARKQRLEAQQFQTLMLSHLPAQFVSDPNIRLKTRITNIKAMKLLKPAKRRKKIKQLIASKSQVAEETKAFRAAIKASQGANGGLPYEQADPYLEKAVGLLSDDQRVALYAANDSVVKRAYMIRDYGGYPQQVEEALKHIPKGFWPINLVDDLVAWRHVDRQLIAERVQEVGATTVKFFRAGDRRALLDSMGDVIGMLGASRKLLKGGFNGDGGEAIRIDLAVSLGNTYYGASEPLRGAVGDVDNWETKSKKQRTKEVFAALETEQKLSVAKALADFTGSFGDVVAQTEVLSASPSASMYASMCPYLTAIGSFLDTGALAVEGQKILKKKKNADAEVTEQIRLLGLTSGLFSFDKAKKKAMIKAMENDANARSIEFTKSVVDATAKIANNFGSVVGFAAERKIPYAAEAAAGLTIVEGTIKFGQKVVFSGMDWQRAKTAMVTIRQAKAGSTEAMVAVFSDSATYAKMYMALQAKTGDPFALSFIKKRGVTQDDIDGSGPLALRLIRKALLDDAGQADDIDEASSLMWNVSSAVLCAAAGLASYVGY